MAASMKLFRQCLHLKGQVSYQKPIRSCIYAIQQQNYSSKQESIDYCVELVKNRDYESFLCTMLYPKTFRGAAFAIRALYTELALVQDVTSDPRSAIMRLQFWKDTIDRIYKGKPPDSPIALQLTKALTKHNLSKSWFVRIIEARADQVNKDINKSLEDIEDIGERTVSSLYYLLLEAGGTKNVHSDHACSHLGKCQSLVTLLRAIPHHANRNKVYLPFQLLAKHKVSQEEIVRSVRKENQVIEQHVLDLVYEIACAAKQHLTKAQSLQKDVSHTTKVIMLNEIILNDYLTKLESSEFNVFNPALQLQNHKLSLKLLKRRMFL